jgi:hypothetical protein|tara:strand:- start:46 stop:369 length:324 start_codon:yes stop_codon:yes gene_type:complete
MKTLKQLRGIVKSPIKQDEHIQIGNLDKNLLREDVEKQLRSVVKKKKESEIQFKSGTSVPIDPEAASVILKTLDSLNSSNKKKMQDNMNKDTKSFLKILDFSFDNVR